MPAINVILGCVNIGAGLVFFGLGLPLAMRRVKRNRWYGFRFRATLASDDVWYEANRFGGKLFIQRAPLVMVTGLLSFVMRPTSMWIIFTSVFPAAIALVSVAETWFFVRGIEREER